MAMPCSLPVAPAVAPVASRGMRLLKGRADTDTDSDATTEQESMTPSTTVDSETESELVEDAEPGAPQLGPGLYHDDVADVTPQRPSQPPVSTVERAPTVETAPGDSRCPDVFPFTKEESLFVFDWDDTILPSSWLQAEGLRLDGGSRVNSRQRRQLADVAPVVGELLRLAKLNGTVVLVTNAERGWIELSCRKFLPTVVPLLENVRLVSARTTYESAEAPSPLHWKCRAFEAEIARFYGVDGLWDARLVKNILSLGDGIHEREALLRLASGAPNCRAKSLKFVERPDLGQLVRQHELIIGCFDSILAHNADLDLCIRCP